LTSYLWDGESRLNQVALPSAIVDTYTYNGDGQRMQKQDSSGTTMPVWDEQNILLDTNASNIIQAVYTLEPILYGNLVSQSRSGVDSFYLYDALGSTRQLASNAGLVTDNYLYDSFGNSLLNGSTENPFRYIGRVGYQYEADPNYIYARARYYDSTSGRFLSRDPLLLANGANMYAYTNNRPTALTDPSGALCAPPGCAGGCIAGSSPVLKSCKITKLETLPESDYSCKYVTPQAICDKLKEYIDKANKDFGKEPWVYNRCSDKSNCKCKDYSLKKQTLTINLKDQLVVVDEKVLFSTVHCAFKVTGTVILTSGALAIVGCEKK
jgi:RHS repeat-associated protein